MERSPSVCQLGRSQAVAEAIDNFGSAIQPFLDAVAERDSVTDPVTEEEFARANQGPAKAQQALVNAIRRSMGKDLGELQVWIGGSLARPENWPRDT